MKKYKPCDKTLYGGDYDGLACAIAARAVKDHQCACNALARGQTRIYGYDPEFVIKDCERFIRTSSFLDDVLKKQVGRLMQERRRQAYELHI